MVVFVALSSFKGFPAMSKVIWHRVGFFFVTLCDWSGKKLALHFEPIG